MPHVLSLYLTCHSPSWNWIGTKYNPLSYLIFYLRGKLRIYRLNFLLYIKLSSSIHSWNGSNSPILHKYIQKHWRHSSRRGQISGDRGLDLKKPNSSVLSLTLNFAATLGWKAWSCSSALLQLQTSFLRKVENWLFKIKDINIST